MKHKRYLENDPEYIRMKKVVIETYDSPSWRFRVSKMNQNQIIAIYFSIQERKYKKLEQEKEFHQVTLFELYPLAMVGQ